MALFTHDEMTKCEHHHLSPCNQFCISGSIYRLWNKILSDSVALRMKHRSCNDSSFVSQKMYFTVKHTLLWDCTKRIWNSQFESILVRMEFSYRNVIPGLKLNIKSTLKCWEFPATVTFHSIRFIHWCERSPMS